MAVNNLSKIDEYGFRRPENYEKYGEIISTYFEILTRRAMRWKRLSEGEKVKKTAKLKRYIRKGIPKSERPKVWMHISGAQKLKEESILSYNEMKQKNTNEEINSMIRLDTPRTFPSNIHFTKDGIYPTQLFNVCSTFAHQNSEVTYCQGLNYITGLLLLATDDEETSFWLLKVLVDKILPKYYIKTMSGLTTDLCVLNELVSIEEPQIYHHFKQFNIELEAVVPKWFICLYNDVLPTETVFRVWDCLFYEGSKILFRVALTIIKMHKEELFNINETMDLSLFFDKIGSHPKILNCHAFMQEIFTAPGSLSNSQIDKLRRKHEKMSK